MQMPTAEIEIIIVNDMSANTDDFRSDKLTLHPFYSAEHRVKTNRS